jgi:hypothetical protein
MSDQRKVREARTQMKDGGFVIDTPEGIAFFRLCTLKTGLAFEVESKSGMKLTRGPSCYSILKKEYGYKGNRKRVLEQVEFDVEVITANRQKGVDYTSPPLAKRMDMHPDVNPRNWDRLDG